MSKRPSDPNTNFSAGVSEAKSESNPLTFCYTISIPIIEKTTMITSIAS